MSYPGLRVVSGPAFLKDKLSSIYAARTTGDGETFAAAFAEDGIFHIIGDTRLVPEAGPRQGHAAIKAVIERLFKTYEYVDALVVDILVDLETAAVRRHLTLRSIATGSIADFDVMDLIRFRDGKIVLLEQFMDTASLALLSGRI